MARQYGSREKQGALIRKLNDMGPVPEDARQGLALSLLVRVAALEVAPARLDELLTDMTRHLIGDLSTLAATLEELAPLFEDEARIRREAATVVESLQRTAACWKQGFKPAESDLAAFREAINLEDEMLREVQLGEYRSALKRVAARLA